MKKFLPNSTNFDYQGNPKLFSKVKIIFANPDDIYKEYLKEHPDKPSSGSLIGLAVHNKQIVFLSKLLFLEGKYKYTTIRGETEDYSLYIALLHELAHIELYLQAIFGGYEDEYLNLPESEIEELVGQIVNEKISDIEGEDYQILPK